MERQAIPGANRGHDGPRCLQHASNRVRVICEAARLPPEMVTDLSRLFVDVRRRRVNGVAFRADPLHALSLLSISAIDFSILKVHVELGPAWDLSAAWVVDPRRNDHVIATIRPVDKAKNATRGCRSLEPVSDDPLVPEADREALPPLMKKLLADYAASGLPPSYLPKDERLPNTDEDDDA